MWLWFIHANVACCHAGLCCCLRTAPEVLVEMATRQCCSGLRSAVRRQEGFTLCCADHLQEKLESVREGIAGASSELQTGLARRQAVAAARALLELMQVTF